MTEEQPYGFTVEANRITEMGGQPFGVRKLAVSVSLSLEGTGEATVVRLDENGYATGEVSNHDIPADGAVSIDLAEDAIYHVVERS